MTRRLAATLALAALMGCGLTLDLEPPDQRPDAALGDFGVPKDEGVGDGFVFPEDLGAERDLAMSEPDLGVDAGRPADMNVTRTCADGCRDTEYCETTLRVCLATEGTCAPRPPEAECVGMLETPVCGCDYRNYRNDCMAAANGVTVAFLGPCPGADEDDWCELMPPPSTVDGCYPCYDDDDCMELTTTAFECVGSTCSPSGAGRCAFTLSPGDCYYDQDCRAGERCDGAELFGCGDPRGLAPVMGSCR